MNLATSRVPPGSWLPPILNRSLSAPLFRVAVMLLLGMAALGARAQEDPPGRVGRLAELRGAVSWWDNDSGRWAEADRNQPLTGGDRLSTASDGRAEVRVGSTTLRLDGNTELEVLRLDDERMAFQLHGGSVAVRVRSREIASEIDLVTAEARLQPLSAGHYRLDRIDDTTTVGAWRGELRIDDPAGFVVAPGQRVELLRETRSGQLRFKIGAPVDDRFAEAVLREDQRDERSVSAKFVSPEMTGVEDLDSNGRWEQNPEYGPVWVPLSVQAGWAPYREGRWTWVRPWGWTWVDAAPWGFAPFHYGRWVYWRNGWAWVPGAYVARPVYAPALVAWLGDGGFGLSIGIGGGPRVGWLPLAPREIYAPVYRVSPRYVERVNPVPKWRWAEPRRGGPVVWANQAAPGAVGVAPRDGLLQRPPGRRWDEGRWDGRDEGRRDDRGDRRNDGRNDGRGGRSPEPAAALNTPPPPPAGQQYGPPRPTNLRSDGPRAPGQEGRRASHDERGPVAQPQPQPLAQPLPQAPAGAQPDPRPVNGPERRGGDRPPAGNDRRDERIGPQDGRRQPQPQPQPQAQPLAQPQPQPQAQPRPQPQLRQEPLPRQEPRPQQQPQPQPQPRQEPRAEPRQEARPEPRQQAQPSQPQPQPQPQPMMGPQRPPAPAPAPAPAAQPAAGPQPAPAPQPAPRPAAERPRDNERERGHERERERRPAPNEAGKEAGK